MTLLEPDSEETGKAGEQAGAYTADSPMIQRLANNILAKAARQQSSYIFLEPGAYALQLGFRTEGLIQSEPPLPWRVAAPLLARFKILAGLNPESQTRIQSANLACRIGGTRYLFALTFLPLQQGEALGIEVREQPGIRPRRQMGDKQTKQANWTALKQAWKLFSPSDRG